MGAGHGLDSFLFSTKKPVTTTAPAKPFTSRQPVVSVRGAATCGKSTSAVQCASRSFTKVFVGRRVAPLPVSGNYRCPSSARLACSSATLAAMASPIHIPSSTACGAKYGAGSSGAALSNPSVKLSANGVPHWPSSAGPAAHFALAVQRATPSALAYLKR